MLVVGLTGGIGSGKSTVAQLFADLGAPIIDADKIAREITAPNQTAFARIVKHFGKDILTKDGMLDRSTLRRIIFTQPKQRLWLEHLLHPQIRLHMQEQIAALSAPYCIAVVPLLLEVEFYSLINRILVIDTPESEQIKRVMARDNVSKSEIEVILSTQASRLDRKAKAHDVILNEGTLADLAPQVEKLHEMYLTMSA